VATDGGFIASPVDADELLVVPGQRYDIFVRGRAAGGSFRLLNLPYDRFGAMSGGMGVTTNNRTETLATLEYTGVADKTWSLPDRLADTSLNGTVAVERSFTFGMGMGMGMFGGGFTINGRQFDPRRVDTRVELGSIEDWDLINPSTMDHPFHLHTNAFQVVGSDGTADGALRDVVLVPAGRRVRVRVPFRDYVGKAMYHCHILDHEDLGMMGIIEVV